MANMFNNSINSSQIEIPIPEHAPKPSDPGNLPEINADNSNIYNTQQLQDFKDTDELVPGKEKPGGITEIAQEACFLDQANQVGKASANGEKCINEVCNADNEPLGFPPKCDPAGMGEDVN